MESNACADRARDRREAAGSHAAAGVADAGLTNTSASAPSQPPERSLLELPLDALALILSLTLGRRGACRALRLSCRTFNDMLLATCTRISWDGTAKEAVAASTCIPSQILDKCPLVTTLDTKNLRKPPRSFWGLPATLKTFRCWGACPPGKQNGAYPRLDLAPIALLTQLEELDISYSHHRVTDLSPLAGCMALRNINISHCAIKSLDHLASCKHLQELNCSHTKITDLSPLAACEQLTELDCSRTKVTDLSPLAACQMLEHVRCTDTPVTDLSPLAMCPKLSLVACDESIQGLSYRFVLYEDCDSDEECEVYFHPALEGVEIEVSESNDRW